MSEKKPQYWFPAKPPGLGWGWGLPITWQGWVVFVSFLVLATGGSLVVGAWIGAFAITGWVVALSVILVLICLWKGEPPGGAGR